MSRSWLLICFAVSMAAFQKPSPFPDIEKTRSNPSVPAPPAVEKKAAAPPSTDAGPGAPATAEVGLASFCGTEKDGRRTATGEAFDSNALTAAHPRLALGSRVKVTNISNGKSVTVRINDRFRSARTVILLSHRAAQELDFIAAGSAQVRIEPVE
jgi:rare lipoprotein A